MRIWFESHRGHHRDEGSRPGNTGRDPSFFRVGLTHLLQEFLILLIVFFVEQIINGHTELHCDNE